MYETSRLPGMRNDVFLEQCRTPIVVQPQPILSELLSRREASFSHNPPGHVRLIYVFSGNGGWLILIVYGPNWGRMTPQFGRAH